MAAVAAQQSPRMSKKDKKKGKKAKAGKAVDLVPNKRVSEEEEEEEDSGLEMACEKQSIDSTEDNMGKGDSTPSPAPAATKEKKKNTPDSSSSGAFKEIRAAMAAESAFASVALRLLVIPKHKMEGEEVDDDDDGEVNLEKGEERNAPSI